MVGAALVALLLFVTSIRPSVSQLVQVESGLVIVENVFVYSTFFGENIDVDEEFDDVRLSVLRPEDHDKYCEYATSYIENGVFVQNPELIEKYNGTILIVPADFICSSKNFVEENTVFPCGLLFVQGVMFSRNNIFQNSAVKSHPGDRFESAYEQFKLIGRRDRCFSVDVIENEKLEDVVADLEAFDGSFQNGTRYSLTKRKNRFQDIYENGFVRFVFQGLLACLFIWIALLSGVYLHGRLKESEKKPKWITTPNVVLFVNTISALFLGIMIYAIEGYGIVGFFASNFRGSMRSILFGTSVALDFLLLRQWNNVLRKTTLAAEPNSNWWLRNWTLFGAGSLLVLDVAFFVVQNSRAIELRLVTFIFPGIYILAQLFIAFKLWRATSKVVRQLKVAIHATTRKGSSAPSSGDMMMQHARKIAISNVQMHTLKRLVLSIRISYLGALISTLALVTIGIVPFYWKVPVFHILTNFIFGASKACNVLAQTVACGPQRQIADELSKVMNTMAKSTNMMTTGNTTIQTSGNVTGLASEKGNRTILVDESEFDSACVRA